MATSATVTAGTNALAQHYNDVRTDAITEPIRYFFEIKGTLVTGSGQATIPIADTGVITKIKHRVTSGSATITVTNDGNTVKGSISVGTSYSDETSGLGNTTATEGDELAIDVDSSSSGVTLRVLVYVTHTK